MRSAPPNRTQLYGSVGIGADADGKPTALVTNMNASPVGFTKKELRWMERSRERMEREMYLNNRAAVAEEKTNEVAHRMERIESLLTYRVRAPLTERLRDRINQDCEVEPIRVASLKKPPEPSPDDFMPPRPSSMSLLLGWTRDTYKRRCAEGHSQYSFALAQWRSNIQQITTKEDQEREAALKRNIASALRKKNAKDEAVKKYDAAMAGDPVHVNQLISKLLSLDKLPHGFPRSHRVAYSGESRLIGIERQLPDQLVIPQIRAFKYVKSSDSYSTLPRPAADVRAAYRALVAQFALRTLLVIASDPLASVIDTIALNCYVDAIDPATGNQRRSVLISLTASVEEFRMLDLAHVDPAACIRGLKAVVSSSPSELQGVRPVFDFDMSDPRFIGKTDVLTGLDSRPNLAELTPSEFEQLMTNLLDKMGLETRLTQASRDGGVDCVAWDMRPVIGGKVVVQAKRYKHTVGVSAVRDLYGTLMNEGAAKGLLVTTSGFGTASFEFAKNKPLELIDGANLIYLLKEHAGMDARISFPETWTDPTD